AVGHTGVDAHVGRAVAGVGGAGVAVVALAGQIAAARNWIVHALMSHVAGVGGARVSVVTVGIRVAAATHWRVRALMRPQIARIGCALVAVITHGIGGTARCNGRGHAHVGAGVAGGGAAGGGGVAIGVAAAAAGHRRVPAHHAHARILRAHGAVVTLHVRSAAARDHGVRAGLSDFVTMVLRACILVVAVWITGAATRAQCILAATALTHIIGARDVIVTIRVRPAARVGVHAHAVLADVVGAGIVVLAVRGRGAARAPIRTPGAVSRSRR